MFSWFQSLKLPSTQSESPLAPKSNLSFKLCTQLWTEFFVIRSGLTVTGLAKLCYIHIIYQITILGGLPVHYMASQEGRCLCKLTEYGRATAQAVRRRLPTTTAQLRSCGICGGQSGTGAGFLRVLRFPLRILILLTASRPSSIIQGWYSRPISGRRTNWTQSHPHPKKLKKKKLSL
jgi:hypothetical protein